MAITEHHGIRIVPYRNQLRYIYGGDQLDDKCVTFVTDNAALVDIINKQTSKYKLVMILIRDMVLTTLKFNIFFTARHLPGKLNERADLISLFSDRAVQGNIPWNGRIASASSREPSAQELVAQLNENFSILV